MNVFRVLKPFYNQSLYNIAGGYKKKEIQLIKSHKIFKQCTRLSRDRSLVSSSIPAQ